MRNKAAEKILRIIADELPATVNVSRLSNNGTKTTNQVKPLKINHYKRLKPIYKVHGVAGIYEYGTALYQEELWDNWRDILGEFFGFVIEVKEGYRGANRHEIAIRRATKSDVDNQKNN